MLAGSVFVPKEHRAYRKAKKYLTIKVFDVGEQKSDTFLAYVDDERGIWVPRDYARRLGLIPDPSELAFGYEIPDGVMQPIELRDEQKPFVNALEKHCREGRDYSECVDLRAEAATGKGKTVMSLELCKRLQTTTLIIVDQEFLRDQWIETLTVNKHGFGFQVPREEIGIVQGKKEDWEDKSFVVGMIQTLYDRDMPEDFWNYFGVCIFDESHTVGAKQFSRILQKIPAAIRIGVSATSERQDELEKVLDAALGPVQVVLAAQHAQSQVRYVTYTGNCYSWYANTSGKSGRYISEIAEDGQRTRLLCLILMSMWKAGRHILGVSDRVEHLEDVALILEGMGVPKEEIGIIAGFTTAFVYAKDDKPRRKPVGWVKGTEYTPVKLQRVRKRTKAKELNAAKDNAKIILATYGKFEKGVDVPRLDAGLDMTPRSKAQQLHGRILREMEGKSVPVWVTIRDKKSPRAEHQFASRLTEYVKSNAEVYEWVLGKGPTKVDAAQLSLEARQHSAQMKSGRITTKRDGNYTVTIPLTVRESRKIAAAPTGKRTRKGRTRSQTARRSRKRL